MGYYIYSGYIYIYDYGIYVSDMIGIYIRGCNMRMNYNDLTVTSLEGYCSNGNPGILPRWPSNNSGIYSGCIWLWWDRTMGYNWEIYTLRISPGSFLTGCCKEAMGHKKKFEDLLFLEMVICLICIDYVKRPDIIYSMDVWDIIGIYRQENPADVSFGMIYESVHYSIQMVSWEVLGLHSWGNTTSINSCRFSHAWWVAW